MQKEGILQIESWSLYSLEQRLMAAAQVWVLAHKITDRKQPRKENVNAFKVILTLLTLMNDRGR